MQGEVDLSELDALDGEVLPERAALSLIYVSGVNINILSSSSNNSYSMPPGGGGGVAYACQATSSPGTPGLLGLLGLGSSNPSSGMTCVPAAIMNG
jgi:hypothetical protein